MKAVVMAGGLGSRLRPALAKPINKHLATVGGKPLIFWPLELLGRSGVTDVLVLLNGTHPELLLETIGTGEDFGISASYRYTPETHGASVGKHLLLAEQWVGADPFLLLLGDSVFFLDTIPDLNTATPVHSWIMPTEAAWDDPSKYASAPGKQGLIQTGLWLFDHHLFAKVHELFMVEELRIRHLVEALYEQYGGIGYTVLKSGQFIDCGTPHAISVVNQTLP